MRKCVSFTAGLAAAAALLAGAAFFGCKTEADEPSPAKKSPSVTIGAQSNTVTTGSAAAAKFPVTIADISGVTSETAVTLTWNPENDPTPPPLYDQNSGPDGGERAELQLRTGGKLA